MNIFRTYDFRLYPTKAQAREIQTHLWVSKNLWNEGLELAKQLYNNYQKFPTRRTYAEMSKKSGLYAQVARDVFTRLDLALNAKVRRKKAGLNGGFPRFKSVDRMKSLHYPQQGFALNGKKLKVSPFGEINIKKHREIEGKIKTLTLKRESSGKWFAIFAVEQEAKTSLENHGQPVGIDLGLKTLAVLSDGTKIRNPKHLKKHEERLKKKHQDLSSKKKGGKNRLKAKIRLAVLHEKVRNTRRDFLHKLSNRLVHAHSLIALEKLAPSEMVQQNFGKSINDAGWGMFANMLGYKAEEAGCRVIFVNPKNTSKQCSQCGTLVQKTLFERQHDCPACGLSIDRDLNAAINILAKATVGTTERNACEVEPIGSTMKQETMTLSLIGRDSSQDLFQPPSMG